MSPLRIQNNNSNDFTLVSNRFLDIYMPETNGEFIKIYLYLLRYSVGHVLPPSFATIADTLNCTEKDIERALKYWCKKGILDLAFDDKKHITQITFFDLDSEDVATDSKSPELVITTAKALAKVTTPISTPKSLSASRVKELKANEDIAEMLFVAEQYLGKTLSKTDTDRLLYFYEELHFSPDLVEYLIEYCVSKGSKSTRYMEKVALSWHEEGITTVLGAKESSDTYNKNYFSVLKAFGISNRNPVDTEVKMMARWFNDFGFSLDIITLACNRTVTTTGKSSFPYADSILTSWHKAGVLTLSDVANLDKVHQEKKPAKTKPVNRAKNNKFNSFPQRNYDYKDLEMQLLTKQSQNGKEKE